MGAGTTAAVTLVVGAAVSATFDRAVSNAKGKIGDIAKDLAALRQQEKAFSSVIGAAAKPGSIIGKHEVAQAQDGLSKVHQQMDLLRNKRAGMGLMSEGFEEMRSSALGTAAAFTTVGVAIQGAIVSPMRAAARAESAALGIAKQLPGARDAAGNLTQEYHTLFKDIQGMARDIPMEANELFEMATAGLRMDVPKEQIKDYVRETAMMATAFELPAGQLGEQMGKISKLYKRPIAEIGELGDTINWLDDNAISKGGDIIDVMQRIGGTAAMVKMADKDAAALSSTLLTLGASSEVSATAANALMTNLATAASGTKKQKKAMLELGLDPETIGAEMTKDATGTILKVLDALNKIPEEKRLDIATQLYGREYADDVSKLASNVGEYRRQLKLANSEEAKGSMKREFEAQKKSAAAQLKLFNSRVEALQVNVGQHLLPIAISAADKVGAIVTFINDAIGDSAIAVQAISSLIVGIPFAIATAKMVGMYRSAKKVYDGFRQARQASAALKLATEANARPGLWSRIGNGARTALGSVGRAVRRMGGALGRGASSVFRFGRRFSGALVGRVSAGLKTVGSVLGKLGGHLLRFGKTMMIVGRALLTNPLFLAIGLLAGAAYLVYKNWEPISQFFGDLWAGIKETMAPVVDWVMARFDEFSAWLAPWVKAAKDIFNGLWEGVKKVFGWIIEKLDKVMGAVKDGVEWMSEKLEPAKGAYDSAVSTASDWIEKGVNWFSGTEPVRADAPVVPRSLPATPIARAAGGAGVQNQQVTINVTQQPGEDGAALARRVVAEQQRAQQVRARGMMYDAPAGAY